ncbi:hypothetical protein NCER_101564 [Vairimorpha ceranae BRL01]|uniref:Uncharacterized protein n=2 Tax=Vairimorpha ceranae TaxID=40302 RepID=C4VAA9_VAIC1|nr:transposable element tcb2 transposase [Vairimorpha ceranae]EEQ81842.1 hypothetical protein NCER_101564 [Vairimorpha ceranae BRL01]KKO73754.1 transposable element tcb2 transposase [Vairimorpha ceranae]
MLLLSDNEIKKICFSDESKFCLFFSDGKVSVWWEAGADLKTCNLPATVNYDGGSEMVWGCFIYLCVGKLVFIKGKTNSEYYVNILSNSLFNPVRFMDLQDNIFQQDNDHKHTAKLTKLYFKL